MHTEADLNVLSANENSASNCDVIVKNSNYNHTEFSIGFNIYFELTLDLNILRDKLSAKYRESVSEEELVTIFKVKSNSLKIVPHLKEYNTKNTDYDAIVEIIHNNRGRLSAKKFGF